MNRLVKNYIYVFAILGVASCATISANHGPSQKNYLDNGEDQEMASIIRSGFSELEGGDYSKAIDSFRKALDMPKDELPNYELNIPLAFAMCRSGDKEGGKKTLKDASCMMDVDAGKVHCAAEETKQQFFASGGTEACYLTMCGEMYLPSYGADTEDQTLHFEGLQEDLRVVAHSCDD